MAFGRGDREPVVPSLHLSRAETPDSRALHAALGKAGVRRRSLDSGPLARVVSGSRCVAPRPGSGFVTGQKPVHQPPARAPHPALMHTAFLRGSPRPTSA